MDADQIVRDFCAAWSRSDLEGILSFFTEDAVYHNIPMEACEGRENIRNLIGGMFSTIASIDFDIRIQVTNGLLVLNERIDTLVMGEKTIALPVCGVFELTEEGLIKAWRDYFDAAQFAGA